MSDSPLWPVRRVIDFGREFWDVFVEGEFVARHKEPTYAELHAAAMNAIGRDPMVQEAVEFEAMQRLGRLSRHGEPHPRTCAHPSTREVRCRPCVD